MRGDQSVEGERDAVAPTRPDEVGRHPRFSGSSANCLGKLTSLLIGSVTLIAAVTAMTAVVTRVDSETDAFPMTIPVEASPSAAAALAKSDPAPPCALKYADVLDLAELERSYGKTSRAYRGAVGNVSGRLNDCRITERVTQSDSVLRVASAARVA
jgi:hypothetical protein